MSILRRLYYRLPPGLRFKARRLWYAPVDILDWMRGSRDSLSPPRGLIYTGSGDFRKQGEAMVKRFIALGGLLPEHRVLDIGSGIGRMAVPLTKYLSGGSYEGFDVIELGVAWCRAHISERYPGFTFRYVGLSNDLYRKAGLNPSQFIFPYADREFDFGFAISVFTHMLPEEVEQYLEQISRVLKPGAIFMGTFFLMNAARAGRQKKGGTFVFERESSHHWLMDKRVKAANVAYEESWLMPVIASKGLRVKQVQYGYWCGPSESENPDFQDIIVLENNQDCL